MVNNPIRILYLTNNADRASTTVPTKGWISTLASRGLCPVLASPQVGQLHTWALERQVASYHLPLPFPSKTKPWLFLHSLWRLRALVKHHSIELIHCNEQNVYPIGQYLGRLSGLPVVVSVHFTMDRGFCEWAFGGARRPRRIFFVSRGNLEACRVGLSGVIPEADWRVLYNGLDLEEYRPKQDLGALFRKEHGLGSGLLVGTACALRPRKQIEHLFEATLRLSMPQIRVVLAGGPVPGDEAYADGLLEEGRRKLGDQLVYLGHLEELRGFYNALDLFVNTSREEAFSISVLEALACGCPVIGYPSTSVQEAVLPDGGEIVPQDDIHVLVESLRRWLGDQERVKASRQKARKRAEYFDIRRIADQLWDEYQCVLNGRWQH